MKITKYEHACVVVEEGEQTLVIDPGVFVKSLPDLTNVAAIVVTHVHQDHFNPELIQDIRKNNPKAIVISTAETIKELGEENTKVVSGGDSVQIGQLHLEFFGDEHATIHPSYPRSQNIGVLVNETFYYPGDSFVQPDKNIEILAVPVYAPWMKMSEAMDFSADIKPKQAFPTHNAFLSDAGNDLTDRLMSFTESVGTKFTHLEPGESLEV